MEARRSRVEAESSRERRASRATGPGRAGLSSRVETPADRVRAVSLSFREVVTCRVSRNSLVCVYLSLRS